MSWKAFLLILLIIVFGVFIYFKLQVLGSPTSQFNQTTRFALGKHPVLRTIFGLHGSGDARAEYLEGSGTLSIEWFAPQTEIIDQNTMQIFSALVSKYTGRQTQLVAGGPIDDNTINLADLPSYRIKAGVQVPSGSTLLVFFTEDYLPRPEDEISRTFQETGMVLSLNAHRSFIQGYTQDLNNYLLSSMLHEFGNQIGMQETATGSPDCIMNLHAGINGQPLEVYGQSEPQDFCPSEVNEINNIKFSLQ